MDCASGGDVLRGTAAEALAGVIDRDCADLMSETHKLQPLLMFKRTLTRFRRRGFP
jgi:hypothetical protein